MSVEAVTWALSDAPDVPPQCLAVLIGLANHAHPDGRGAYPSQETLAHYARKSVRSVRTDLAELERLGLIRRALRSGRRVVVWDLAIERRRPAAHPVDKPAGHVPERQCASAQPGSTLPSNPEVSFRSTRKWASDEPSKNHQRTQRAHAPAPPGARGAALPPPRTAAGRCARHLGQMAAHCAPCRSELLEVRR
jgi:hypothetical protein